MARVKVTSQDGASLEFDDAAPAGSGAMKDVYFSPDKSYVIGFLRQRPDINSLERLQNLVTAYRTGIIEGPGGEYWAKLFCWPTHLVEHRGAIGIVLPTYEKHFFFKHGSKNNDFLGIRGKEKEGKWFASANHQQKSLDDRERGSWINYLQVSIKIARAARRMHAAGLAHSDLSYKNVLIDPAGGNACIIDVDSLVVPRKFPPDVVGTPDFIAPEVMATLNLPAGDRRRKLPCRETDQHALAVLIYMYLLYRHPLRGGKIHDQDPQRDEELAMGERALFIEHPTDWSNRPNLGEIRASYFPFADPAKIPYTVCGPYLTELFNRAFIEGLHAPERRPTADDWEWALIKTVDLVQPCSNPACAQKWYVFDNTNRPKCPFCNTPFKGPLPVLNLYSSRSVGRFLPENHRIMVYSDQYLYPWHVNRSIVPNERMSDDEKRPVGYFKFHKGAWWFLNQQLPEIRTIKSGQTYRPKDMVPIVNDEQILLDPSPGGRLIHVQMANQ